MKKLMITGLLAVALSGAYAQRHSGGVVVVRPRTTYIVGSGFYSPYYSPFYSSFYSPFNSPFGFGSQLGQRSVQPKPTKLDQTMADIEHEYSQRISSARAALSGKEKRDEVRRLKEARDAEIDLAKRNYYKESNT